MCGRQLPQDDAQLWAPLAPAQQRGFTEPRPA